MVRKIVRSQPTEVERTFLMHKSVFKILTFNYTIITNFFAARYQLNICQSDLYLGHVAPTMTSYMEKK